MAFPEFQTSLTALKEGQYTLNPTHPLPSHNPLPPSYIPIRVSFVALNPCNWKMIDFSPAIGTVGGNDFSGRVVSIGSAVRKWQIGDSVCGFLYGLDPHLDEGEWAGAFAEYVSVPGDLVMRVVEDQVGMADAACLGAGVTALGGLSLRDEASTGSRKASPSPYFLMYGGSTATGTMAIQLARLAEYSPITTCWPGHNALVQSYGAIKAFDYGSASCGVTIRAFTKGKLSLILDCITSTDSMKICYAAMGAHRGRYVALEPPATRIQTARKDVQTGWVMALTIFGKPVELKRPFGRDAVPGDYELAAKWYEQAGKPVEEGLLRPHPASVRPG
ncbi:hypothetical protein BDV24DRAFT_174279 [Aspergillus arachidicola]|uniref:Enoyl reductase (ER) domain-containing protein n=1 Tax=Aspergillus arachidicola TaxID=656916 RepID=A0A5N6YAL5_9EURO|nr:hypothetical protein BDV24DRAFT_174279 [Aspergillus arachidicola]